MRHQSKIIPVMAVFSLLTGLTACSSSSDIQIADNLGATTGLPEVATRVDSLTTSHRNINHRFGALETLYIDLQKSTIDQADMVGKMKVFLSEYSLLKRDLVTMKTRLQRSEALSSQLLDRITALEALIKESAQLSMTSPSGGASDPNKQQSANGSELYAVHLASFRETAQITSGWRSLQTKYPRALGGLSAKIETSTMPQLGSFLRLLVGPFSSLSEAKTLCDTLQSQNQYCKPAPFLGEILQ